MKCKVSVIIPVYNSEKYLQRVILSLKEQTLKEMEFIFVDDCSTDNSLNILYEFEKIDPERVLVIKLDENLGPGGARNAALQYTSGEYIAFADSDDYMDKNMYELMYEKAKEDDYDIVDCGYYRERKNKDMYLWSKSMEGEVTLEKRVMMFITCGFLWSKLYKSDVIRNSGIQFIERLQYEDVDFLNRLYCRIHKVGIFDKPLYHYCNNEDSFTNKGKRNGFFKINDIFSSKYLDNMRRENNFEILRPVIENVVLGIWFDMFKTYVAVENKNMDDFLKIIDKEIKKYIPDYGHNLFFEEQAKKDKVKAAFLMNCYDRNKAKRLIDAISV